ncbi:MAG: PEP-CTERM/exosortase system-associated acyltransferase [Nitrosospira sp.]|nr:PEP-CTERM/exosortase system-associated acyltransferase [Nitrosospira sp.]
MNDIVAAFHEYFEVIYADTPELLHEVFRLRYQVLCIEQRLPGFDASCYPEGYERDSYDGHSSHILLQHRPSGDFVGTARLILPLPTRPEKPFPVELHTRLEPKLFDSTKLPRRHTAEVSRLLVIRRLRQRREDSGKFDSELIIKEAGVKKLRRFPHPILALVVGLVRMSVERDITHWISIMDPALNRLLGLYGLQHDPVGPIIEHHGQRRPYHANLTITLDRMYKNHNQIWELLTDFGRIQPIPTERAKLPASAALIAQ